MGCFGRCDCIFGDVMFQTGSISEWCFLLVWVLVLLFQSCCLGGSLPLFGGVVVVEWWW